MGGEFSATFGLEHGHHMIALRQREMDDGWWHAAWDCSCGLQSNCAGQDRYEVLLAIRSDWSHHSRGPNWYGRKKLLDIYRRELPTLEAMHRSFMCLLRRDDAYRSFHVVDLEFEPPIAENSPTTV